MEARPHSRRVRETQVRPATNRARQVRRARRLASVRTTRHSTRLTGDDSSNYAPSAPPGPGNLRIIAPSQRGPWLDGRELWAYRELLAFFVWRDIKVRYRQTLLGASWALLQPLATMIVFSVIFGRLARLDSDGIPYPAFCLVGLLPWLLFSSGLTQAAASLTGNVNLITKVYFPRLLLPLSNVLSSLVDFGVMAFLLAVVLAWYGILPGWRVLLLPLPIGLALVTAAGGGFWLSALNAQYRDIRYVMPFLVQLWMYGTPIVYSLQIVPAGWRAVFAVNPLVGAVEAFRYAVLGTDRLTPEIVWVSSLAATVLLITGTWYFRRVERLVADTI